MERSLLDDLAEVVREATQNVPASHGWPHLRKTAEIAYYLALSLKIDPFLPSAAALVHDLRWWSEEERRVRKIKIDESWKSTTSAKEALAKAGVSLEDQGVILTAAANHRSTSSEQLEQIVADADRASRMGIEGLLSILYADLKYGVPFYNRGRPILWDQHSPLVPNEEIESCIDDVRACQGWWLLQQTTPGIRLFRLTTRVNDRFLRLFAENQKDSYEAWIPRLERIRRSQQEIRESLYRSLLEKKDPSLYEAAVIRLESPDLLDQTI